MKRTTNFVLVFLAIILFASIATASGVFLWKKMAINPFNLLCKGPVDYDRVAKKLGLTPDEKEGLQAMREKKEYDFGSFCPNPKKVIFTRMMTGNYKVVENVIWAGDTCQGMRIYKLSSGRTIAEPLRCGNLAVMAEEEKIEEEVIPPQPLTPMKPIPEPVPNKPPVAKLNEKATVDIYAEAYIDGSASYDEDGRIVKYHWKLISAPENSNQYFEFKKRSDRFSFEPDKEGEWVFQLIVEDDKGAKSAPVQTSVETTYKRYEFYSITTASISGDKNNHEKGLMQGFIGKAKPWKFELEDGSNFQQGFVGYANETWGDDYDYNSDQRRIDYSFDNRRIMGGLTTEFSWNSQNISIDYMLGRQDAKGHTNDGYESNQKTLFAYVSVVYAWEARRNEGESALPKIEFLLNHTIPIRDHHEHSWQGQELPPDNFDYRHIALGANVSLYDYHIQRWYDWTVTPIFKVGWEKSWGDDHNYWYAGPSITIAADKEDLLYIDFCRYREQLGGDDDQIMILGFSVPLHAFFN